MHLLKSDERRRLTNQILLWLAPTALASSELCNLTGQHRAAVQSVVVALAGRGVIEPVDRVRTAAGVEYIWRISDHGWHREKGDRLPGTPRCPYCRRFNRR